MGKIILGNDKFSGEVILPKYESDTYTDGLGIRLKPRGINFNFHEFLGDGLEDLVELTKNRAMVVIETEVDFSPRGDAPAPVLNPKIDFDGQQIASSASGDVDFWRSLEIVNEGPNGLFYHFDRRLAVNMLTPANGTLGLPRKMTDMRNRPDTVVAPLPDVDSVIKKLLRKWKKRKGEIKMDDQTTVEHALTLAGTFSGNLGKNTISYISNLARLSNNGNSFLMQEVTEALDDKNALLRHSWSKEAGPTVLVFSGDQADLRIRSTCNLPRALHGRMPATPRRKGSAITTNWTGKLYLTGLRDDSYTDVLRKQ